MEKENPRVVSLLTEAKKKFAPDKRTAVFDVRGSLKGKELTLAGEVHDEAMKRQLLEFLKEENQFSVVDSLVALPHASLEGKVFGVVSTSVANLRVKPSHAEEMATQVLLGTPLRVLNHDDGWYLVQTPEDYLGWTDDMVAMMTKDEYERWSLRQKVIVTTTYAHVYRMKEKTETVGDIVAGNILALQSADSKWFEVEYPNGKQGLVAKEDATPLDEWLAQAKDNPESIVATAKRFMGVPYLWGGTSTKAMDCSGFTKTVFFLNGVLLPRDASQQALVGEPVQLLEDRTGLKTGDLVFFGRRATAERGERVTHVGIYLDDDKFIHEGGDVRINSFNPKDENYSEFRASTLLSARRVIGVGEERGVRRLASIPYYRTND
jgi:cell wall-associated NlpC family hydrolase